MQIHGFFRRSRVLPISATAVGLLAIACSNPTAPPTPGIIVISPQASPDTIDARLNQPLVVEVRDSAGRVQPGIAVQFEAQPLVAGGMSSPGVLLRPVGATTYTALGTVTADQLGRAAVDVALGGIVGEAEVRISVPTLGYSTSSTFYIEPGAPFVVQAAPADTVVYVGTGFSLRVAVADRRGNAREDTLAFSAEGGAVEVTAGTVNAIAPGRAEISVSRGDRSSTVHVSVVPEGVLIAARSDGIYTFGLDGSGYRRVVSHSGARSPRWLPDGSGFVYSVGLGHAFVSNLEGVTRRLVPDSGLEAELWAHPSRDGAWIYFGGYSGAWFQGYPYRVRPDGSDLQLVPGFTPDDHTQGHPSPSPDGNRLVYFREVSGSRDVVIRRLDMASGALIGPDVPGHSPAWSNGETIAYLNVQGDDRGPIMVMNPDGSGQRVISNERYSFGIDWSPDDRWIVASNVQLNRLEVVEVSTGLRIPLPYSAGLFNPSWQP